MVQQRPRPRASGLAVGAGEVELRAAGLADDGVEVELVEAPNDQVGEAEVLVDGVARRGDDAREAGRLGGEEPVVGVLDGDAVLGGDAQLANGESVDLGVRLELADGAGGEDLEVLGALFAHEVDDVSDGAVVGAGANGELHARSDCLIHDVVHSWSQRNLLGIYEIIEDFFLPRVYFRCHCVIKMKSAFYQSEQSEQKYFLTIDVHLIPSVPFPELQ